jgi:hypothetical protein
VAQGLGVMRHVVQPETKKSHPKLLDGFFWCFVGLINHFFFHDHLTFMVKFAIQPESSVWQVEFSGSGALG